MKIKEMKESVLRMLRSLMVMILMIVLGSYYQVSKITKSITQRVWNMLKRLNRQLLNLLTATKHLFTGRWSFLNRESKEKRTVIHLDVEVLEELIRTKDDFIAFLQDEIAELKALNRDEKPVRVRQETDFQSNRGYKSIHTRVRENVLARKKRETPVSLEEQQYEKVVVNE